MQAAAAPTIADVQALLQNLTDVPFYAHADFWFNFVLSAIGVTFSVLAFLEAKQAKVAARAAGKTVKIQSIAIDLGEIDQKISRVRRAISYDEAAQVFQEINAKLRRILTPFQKDTDLGETVKEMFDVLVATRLALDKVRPDDASAEAEAPRSVFNGIENNFIAISNVVSGLLGLFEDRASTPAGVANV